MKAQARGYWSASLSGCFNTRERAPGTHWLGSVEPRAGLDELDRKFLTLLGLELFDTAVMQPVARIMVVGKYIVHLIYVVWYLSECL
jgi:hypothetical protein